MNEYDVDEHDKSLLVIASILCEGDLTQVRGDLYERLNSPRMYPKLRERISEDIGRLDRLLEVR